MIPSLLILAETTLDFVYSWALSTYQAELKV